MSDIKTLTVSEYVALRSKADAVDELVEALRATSAYGHAFPDTTARYVEIPREHIKRIDALLAKHKAPS